MFLYANYNPDNTINGVIVGLVETESFPLKITNEITGNNITIGTSKVKFEKFLKNLKSFVIINNGDGTGSVTFKTGQTASNFDDSIIPEFDSSIPMAYTRANTVVNFGSL